MPPCCVTSPPIANARSLVPLCRRWTTTDPKPPRQHPPSVPNPHFFPREFQRDVCMMYKIIYCGDRSAPWSLQPKKANSQPKTLDFSWLNYQGILRSKTHCFTPTNGFKYTGAAEPLPVPNATLLTAGTFLRWMDEERGGREGWREG